MFDDVPKTNELTKELAELKEAITSLVEVVKPLAVEAELRAAERKRAAARFETEMAVRASMHRCDCSPTRSRAMVGGMWSELESRMAFDNE